LDIDLQQPLPGQEAQFRMAPRPRPGAEFYDRPREDARRGGVLILLYPHGQSIYFPLILRPTYSGVHSGQVGLPGGGYEENDPDLVYTALRETHEEIGVPAEEVQVIGRLSPLYVYPSNYLVQPVVGWLDYRPTFHIDPNEVAMLIEAPLLDFLNPQNRLCEPWQLRDRMADVPFFRVQNQRIWGATAMMLSELLALPAMEHLPGIWKREDEFWSI
jgi:8-oxo-dGTP pyrophosphatase MutT (NUDIX family)